MTKRDPKNTLGYVKDQHTFSLFFVGGGNVSAEGSLSAPTEEREDLEWSVQSNDFRRRHWKHSWDRIISK